jgi:hypothetical protein
LEVIMADTFFRGLTEAQKRSALRVGSSIPAVKAFDSALGNVVEQAIVEISVPAAAQADTVAADLAALKVDFNALLAKLKAAGLMASA